MNAPTEAPSPKKVQAVETGSISAALHVPSSSRLFDEGCSQVLKFLIRRHSLEYLVNMSAERLNAAN